MSFRAYVGLGSNLGDRRAHLAWALDALERRPGVGVVRVSSVYETAPMACAGGPFLNAVAEVRSKPPPVQLLSILLELERLCGRRRSGHERRAVAAPRCLDLDLLHVEGPGRKPLQLRGPDLELPHPRLVERDFVLAPLCELAPRLEVCGRSVAGWYRRLPEEARTVIGRCGEPLALPGIAAP